jgi:probable rRNA maturation factor
MSSPEGSTVNFRRVPATLRRRSIENFARKLEAEVSKGRAFDTLITGDAEIRRLNRDFRGQDYPTDVLSFPSGDPAVSLGDLAISLNRARAQARQFGHTVEQEIEILMLHGLLHLLGFDHEADSGLMARAEKRWRARLALPNSLIERVQG